MGVKDDLLPAAGQLGLPIARFAVDVSRSRGLLHLRGDGLRRRFGLGFRQLADQDPFPAVLSMDVSLRLFLSAEQDRVPLCPAGVRVGVFLHSAGQILLRPITAVCVGVLLHSAGQVRFPRPITAVRVGMSAALFHRAGLCQLIARIRVDMARSMVRGALRFRKGAVLSGALRLFKAAEQFRLAVAGCAVDVRLDFRQGADQPAVFIAAAAVGMYGKIRIAAEDPPLAVKAAAGVLVEAQPAIQRRRPLQGERRHGVRGENRRRKSGGQHQGGGPPAAGPEARASAAFPFCAVEHGGPPFRFATRSIRILPAARP